MTKSSQMTLDDPKMLIADADDTDHCTRVIDFVDDTYADANDNLHNADDDTDHCTRVIPHSCWLVWRVLVLRDSGPIHLVRKINRKPRIFKNITF